jgi:hypothetical protein
MPDHLWGKRPGAVPSAGAPPGFSTGFHEKASFCQGTKADVAAAVRSCAESRLASIRTLEGPIPLRTGAHWGSTVSYAAIC